MKDKYLRVMCDYSAAGLWARGAVHPNDYDITQDLRDRIAAWQEWYEKDGEEFGAEKMEPIRNAFAAEGLTIAIELKRQLPDFTIFYFDEMKLAEYNSLLKLNKNEFSTHGDRSYFEYEITADMLLVH